MEGAGRLLPSLDLCLDIYLQSHNHYSRFGPHRFLPAAASAAAPAAAPAAPAASAAAPVAASCAAGSAAARGSSALLRSRQARARWAEAAAILWSGPPPGCFHKLLVL